MGKAIKVEHLYKQYRLGQIGTGTLGHDLNKWWARIKGKEDPFINIGDSNELRKSDGGEYVWALKDINFDVNHGDILGIIGKNGAGKSTLLKILSKVTGPTKGTITLEGRLASLLEVGTGFHPDLTGKENIYLNGAILGMSKREIRRKIEEIVDFSGIEKYIETPVKRYSSGMYVRLAFAVAAHLEPDILIVDEVLAVGDAEFQKKCIGKMEDVSKKEGRTVLLVSHNMGVISAICSKCIVLENGCIQAHDEVDKVISTYLNDGSYEVLRVIENNMRVKGNGLVTIEECSISNDKGSKKNTFIIGENIKMDFKIKSNIECFAGFWLIIRDKEGKPILCSHQKDLEKQSIGKGSYSMVYQTESLSLLPGNYFVSAGVLSYDYSTFYEWVDNCQAFEVLPAFSNGAKYDSRLGYVMQKASWNLSKIS